MDDTAKDGAVQHKGHGYAHGNAEKAQHGIRKPRQARQIVRIGQIPHTIGKRHARDKRHNGTNDNVAQAVSEAQAPAGDGNQTGHHGAGNAAHNPRQVTRTDILHVKEKHETRDAGGRAIGKASAKHGRESARAKGRCHQLLPEGLEGHCLDLLQPLTRLLQGTSARRNVITEPVHSRHPGKLRGPDGNKRHIGIGRSLSAGLMHLLRLSTGENTVGKHEEIAGVHPEVRGYPVHDILHTGNLRTILQ